LWPVAGIAVVTEGFWLINVLEISLAKYTKKM
jgi:hypothetical protein